ncbi:ABC transporter substrate-binding protein [Erwinia oleae]|uniref:ABC transporter substrate-binding protein n=1 Tax=Erwinia oleae TaxID=796334 RepID=UPI00054DC6FC|nr:ABC transporter substrate-binding protein [Erwinia oleae]
MRRFTLTLLAASLVIGLAQAATPKDTLVVAIPLDGIISFDPAEAFETVSNGSLRNIYEQLVTLDRNDSQKLVPGLASAWQPGSNEHSLRFTLRDGARFASGNAVTPQDVIFSFSRAVRLNKSPAFILAELGWTPENVDSHLKATGDNQVEISWDAGIGRDLVLRLLTAPVASIVDGKLATQHQQQDDKGNGWLRTHSAGSAAYRIRQYVPQQALVLEKNNYAQHAAQLKNVILKNVAEASSRRLLIQQGDVDVAYQLGPDQFAALKQQPGVKVENYPSDLVFYLGFNTQNKQQPLLGNPAFWQAARWLVDYKSLADELLKGQYQVHQSFLPQGFDGALNTTPFHYDVEKAKAILNQAGIKPGSHFSLTVINQPPYIDVAQALQASFAAADVHIDIQPVAEAELWGKMRGRDFQSIFIYWGADYPDAHSNASAFASNVPGGAKTLAWRTGWEIPKISAETRAAAAESDATQRRTRYTQLQTELQQNSPYVTILQGQQLVALRDNLQGAQQGIGNSLLWFDQLIKN